LNANTSRAYFSAVATVQAARYTGQIRDAVPGEWLAGAARG